ncbi:MAG: hypothetical protein HYV03_07150 [Deltaproteobacteria bacterium]|nr:hypothetical protein [Deltaproteobacteria bacterium]
MVHVLCQHQNTDTGFCIDRAAKIFAKSLGIFLQPAAREVSSFAQLPEITFDQSPATGRPCRIFAENTKGSLINMGAVQTISTENGIDSNYMS